MHGQRRDRFDLIDEPELIDDPGAAMPPRRHLAFPSRMREMALAGARRVIATQGRP